MDFPEFVRRFAEHQEIGRDLTDEQLSIFYDNGQDVGVWREDRRTTTGDGEVLGSEAAAMARYWYRRQRASRSAHRSDGPAR